MDQLFDHAVRLATAFVANGDVRLERDGISSESQAQAKLHDLVVTLYETLDKAQATLGLDDAEGR